MILHKLPLCSVIMLLPYYYIVTHFLLFACDYQPVTHVHSCLFIVFFLNLCLYSVYELTETPTIGIYLCVFLNFNPIIFLHCVL